jgi:hypothetical protein
MIVKVFLQHKVLELHFEIFTVILNRKIYFHIFAAIKLIHNALVKIFGG